MKIPGIAAAMFAVAALLSACTVDVEQPRPVPPYGPQAAYCTREYAPVCARRGEDRQTFNNGCLAEEAGYRIVRSGECRGGGDYGGGGGGDYDGGGGGAVDRSCPRDYEPVCARRGNDRRSFANNCRADAAGYRVISDGECGSGGGDYGGGGGGDVAIEKVCPKTLDPVCARRGNDQRTFANDCRAEQAGFRVTYPGECN